MPPTDPRFLDATLEDMILDYWSWRHAEDPKLRDEIVATGFDEDLAEMEAESEAARAVTEKPADDWEVIANDRFPS